MKYPIGLLALVIASSAYAIDPGALQRVQSDAVVIDRVAEMSRRDLPADLLKRIIEEDLDLLRGKRAEGTYEFATYERLEASRTSTSHSVQPRKNDELERIDIRGSWVYRLILGSPSRRLVMTKNRRVYVDRVELEYVPAGGTTATKMSFPVAVWLEPGQIRPIDFPDVARQATARVFVRADRERGYGNLVVTLVQARVVDNADSPYADAVASAKAIVRAIDAGEVPSIRAMAARLRDGLGASAAQPAARTLEVIAPAENDVLHRELQAIEDLLTGTEAEKREGMDRLHRLVRKTRP